LYFVSAVLYGVAWGRLVWNGYNGVQCTMYFYGGSIVRFVPVRGLAKRYGTLMRGVGGTLWWYGTKRYGTGTGTVPYRYGVVRNGVGGRRQCGNPYGRYGTV